MSCGLLDPQDLGVHEDQPAKHAPGIGDVARGAELDAAYTVLALEGVRGIVGRHVVVRASVIDVGLEQRRRRQQALVEQLPLGADLDRARLLRRHVTSVAAETVVLRAGGIELASDRSFGGRVGRVDAGDRDGFERYRCASSEIVLNLGGVGGDVRLCSSGGRGGARAADLVTRKSSTRTPPFTIHSFDRWTVSSK